MCDGGCICNGCVVVIGLEREREWVLEAGTAPAVVYWAAEADDGKYEEWGWDWPTGCFPRALWYEATDCASTVPDIGRLLERLRGGLDGEMAFPLASWKVCC
jgi:hypothetical protein